MFQYFLFIFILSFCNLHETGTCNDSLDSLNSIIESFLIQEEAVRSKVEESDEPFFGVLHSQDALDKWAEKENEIVEILEKKLELIDEEIALITEYLEDYDESTGEAMRHLREPKETAEERGKVVGSSAVLGHRMTSRYAGIIAQIRRFLMSDDYLENEDDITRILQESHEFVYDEATNRTKRLAPGSEDLFLSMASFFHIQHAYGYPPSQLIYGFNPQNNDTSDEFRLNALQCAELGMFASFRREYAIAIEWLEVAENLLASGEDDEEYNLPLNIVSSMISLVIQQHNKAFQMPNLRENRETMLNFYDSPIRPDEERIPLQEVLYRSNRDLGSNTSVQTQYMTLCREEIREVRKAQKNLKCHYERNRHPFLYINPVKVEVLSEDPPIFQFYGMINNKTIELVKERYGDKVKPFKQAGLDGEIIPNWETGAYKNFHPEEAPPHIFDLAEAVTGINIRSNREIFQFIEYTAGRYSAPHFDSLQADATPKDRYNRHDEWVSTIVYNLEVSEAGGLTPFCQAGVSGNQIRGSVIFWYNIYRNGTLRTDIHHADCPVLLGRKIILKRQMRYLDNWKNFKCGLDKLE